MVLYKRKQVTFVKPPEVPSDLSTEVFVIPQTKEWFFSYEEYLTRMDYYHRRKFVCEITGNSCLTFFEALESETKEIRGVEKNFPEALREHILRFLQFNRITRLDQLIDKVYSVFRNDYFPGETIYIKSGFARDSSPAYTVMAEDEEIETVALPKHRGTIREKVQYGNTEDLTTKYLVVRLSDMQSSIVTNDRITRDRNHFTKWLIKTFVKLTMTRSHKVGAPWVVKDKYAIKYRISQEYPEDLKHYADSTPNGDTLYEDDNPRVRAKSSESANGVAKKSKKAAQPAGQKLKTIKKKSAKSEPSANKNGSEKGDKKSSLALKTNENGLAADLLAKISPDRRTKFPTHYLPENIRTELGLDENGVVDEKLLTPTTLVALTSLQPNKTNVVEDLHIKFDIQHSKPVPEALVIPENSRSWHQHLVQELEEDLNELTASNGVTVKTNESGENDSENAKKRSERAEQIQRLSSKNLTSISEALQCWIFINVYHSVLKLDSFTFDDFIYSMGWNLDQFNDIGRCELLDEIWCAVLSAIVSNHPPTLQQAKNARLNDEIFGLSVNLPPKKSLLNKVNDDDSDEDRGSDSEPNDKTLKSDDEESANESGSEEQPAQSPRKKTEKKLAQPEEDADDEDEDMEAEEEEEDANGSGDDISDDESEHNAYILMNYRNTPWHDRLRKRVFKDGNWQIILLGVLSLVEHVPAYKSTIEKVYRVLAPKSLPATAATVLTQFYEELDIDLKLQTLTILVNLLANGSVVRNYIDECLETSTVLRRNRLDNIKDYKIHLDLAQKHNILINESLSKLIESRKESEKKEKTGGKDKSGVKEEPPAVNRRYRLNLKIQEMNEDEVELAEKETEFKESWNKRKEALVKLSELKKDKREIENKLTELDCQRVKLLGKDRLFNRYWWFENNGLATFFGGSNEDEDIDEDEKEKEKDRNDDAADVDDEKDEVSDETYLMGRLWIQGPSEDDLKIYFDSTYEESELFKQKFEEYQNSDVATVMDNDIVANGIKQEENHQEIKQESSENGSITKEDLKEAPEPEHIKELSFAGLPEKFTKTVYDLYGIKFGNNNVYRKSQIGDEEVIDIHGALITNQLIHELTSSQRKSIEERPDPLINGGSWRYYENPDEIESLVKWLNPWGKRESSLRKELIAVKDVIKSTMEARSKALWKTKAPEEELEIEAELSQLSDKIAELTKKDVEAQPAEDSEEEDVPIAPGSKKRQLRKKAQVSSSKKRQKLSTVAEVIEFGELDDISEFKEKLSSELEEKRKGRDLQRVLEWVNSTALEEFDKSLYEGGGKSKIKHTRGRPPKKLR